MGTTRLHLGCGLRFHPDWDNVDITPRDPSVRAHDFLEGIPVPDASCSAVYHAHLLEHLRQEEARRFTIDCVRALAPGGILRVVVPDLEVICRSYLDALDRARAGATGAADDHDWMLIELLDQVVREEPGGRMSAWFQAPVRDNLAFVRSRLGTAVDEELGYANGTLTPPPGPPPPTQPDRPERRRRRQLDKLLTDAERQALARDAFRMGGECHRWMYDAFSLTRLLTEAGCEAPRICAADESEIPAFSECGFERDATGWEHHPHSLYLEGRRPAT